MAVITLKVVVAGLADVRAEFNQLKVYRSTTGKLGPYIEATVPGTRIPLEAGKVIYDFVDSDGSGSYFYRISYYNSISGLESSLSDPQQGEGDSALDIVSVEELKMLYLLGVDLTIDDGSPYPEAFFEFYIKAAVSWVEHKLDIPLRPTRYVDEKHDYYGRDYDEFMFLQLNHYPIIEMEKVAMVFPGDTSGGSVFLPPDLYVESESGQVNIIPGSASGSILGYGTYQGRGWSRSDFVPQVFRATYTAGFEAGKVPQDIKDVVGRTASFGPLHIAGDLLGGAGVASQSISIDGLSQSIATTSSPSFAGYGARIINYKNDLKDMIPTLIRYYKGGRLTVA